MRFDHVSRIKNACCEEKFFFSFCIRIVYLFALCFIYLDCYSNNDVNKERKKEKKKRKDSNQYDELLIRKT